MLEVFNLSDSLIDHLHGYSDAFLGIYARQLLTTALLESLEAPCMTGQHRVGETRCHTGSGTCSAPFLLGVGDLTRGLIVVTIWVGTVVPHAPQGLWALPAADDITGRRIDFFGQVLPDALPHTAVEVGLHFVGKMFGKRSRGRISFLDSLSSKDKSGRI
jgi:hypothetical protein